MADREPLLGYQPIPGTLDYLRPDGSRFRYLDRQKKYGDLTLEHAIISDWTDRNARIAMDKEVRVTDPKTGGAKGQKLPQLGAIDPLALLEVAKVAGMGAQKYDTFNYVRGYDWKLSYDANMRHLLEFWNGEDRDEESGLLHTAHAAWHGLALTTFLLRQRGTDTRLPRFLEGLDD